MRCSQHNHFHSKSTNNAPIALSDNYGTVEDTPVTGNVSVNDSDVDGNLNPNGYTLITGVSNGTITFNMDGSFVYSPFQNTNGSILLLGFAIWEFRFIVILQ